MDLNCSSASAMKGCPCPLQDEIKAHIKAVFPQEVYSSWIEHFEFENIDASHIAAVYYGDAPLREFKQKHQAEFFAAIRAVVGDSKKIKLLRARKKPDIFEDPVVRKNIKTVKLFLISVVFMAVAFAIGAILFNYIGNRTFHETFHAVSNIKADSRIRVIQISDLHSCSYGKNNEDLLARIQALEPDVILCTGDILDMEKSDSVQKMADFCGALAEIAPAYYIYGNNEAKYVYDFPLSQQELDRQFGFTDETRDSAQLTALTDAWETLLESRGIRVLKNEQDTIMIGTTAVDIFGVLTSNPSSFWTYAEPNFSRYLCENTDHLKITAVHEPFIFEEFKPDYWGDLLISGHTHGGMVRVPVLGPLYTKERGLFPEKSGYYIYGRYGVSGSPLIVSSGLDNTGIFRINNQPELVVIDINKF